MKHLNHYDIIRESFLKLARRAAGDALRTALPKTYRAIDYIKGKSIDRVALDRLEKQVKKGVAKLKANAITRPNFITHISKGLKAILRSQSVSSTATIEDVVKKVEGKYKYSNFHTVVDLRSENTTTIEEFLTDIYKGCIQRNKNVR